MTPSSAEAPKEEESLGDKRTLRKKYLAARADLDPKKRAEASRIIVKHALSWPLYRSVKVTLLYASFREEVETWDLIRESLKRGKIVLLPRTFVEDKTLRLYQIMTPEKDLSPGYAGILEPRPGLPEATRPPEIIFVPGVAFDVHGGRLGYGGGYYDRLLKKYPEAIRVGLAFGVQICPRLPLEPHDQLMDFLITEEGLIRTRCGPSP